MTDNIKGNYVIVLNRVNWCRDMPNIVFQASHVGIIYFSPWVKYLVNFSLLSPWTYGWMGL